MVRSSASSPEGRARRTSITEEMEYDQDDLNGKYKYEKSEESEHRVYGKALVDWHFYSSTLFPTCFIVFVTYLLYSKTPNQVFFLTQ